jgi:hypothetical protein
MPLRSDIIESAPLRVFFSYAHEDSQIRSSLEKYLVHLKRSQKIATWSDIELTPGESWDEEIRDKLRKADIVVVLLSIDFLNSKYVWETEIAIVQERHRQSKVHLIPVVVRPLPDGANPFPEVQGLPEGFVPTELWGNREEAYVSVSNGIKRAVEKVLASRTKEAAEARSEPLRNSKSPIFCNRDEQEFEFLATCRSLLRSRPGIPQVYVIRGEPLDRPDTLVERLYYGKIPVLASSRLQEKRAGVRPGILHTAERALPWPALGLMLIDDLYQRSDLSHRYTSAFRTEEACAVTLVTADEMRPYSFVVVRHDIDAGRLGEDTGKFLKWYLNVLWRNLLGGPELPQFLIFLNFIFRQPRPAPALMRFWRGAGAVNAIRETVNNALDEVCPESQDRTANLIPGAPGCPCKILKELTPQNQDHIQKWILDSDPRPSETEAEREANRIFTELRSRSSGPVRLDTLANWVTEMQDHA